MKSFIAGLVFSFLYVAAAAQDTSRGVPPADSIVPLAPARHPDTIIPETPARPVDTSLRIINLNPFFSVHVDSNLVYPFQINKNPTQYFWYLKNAPVGIRINKDNGLLSFRADKSYFLSG